MRRSVLALALALLATGCGGDDGSSPAPTPTPTPTPANAAPTITSAGSVSVAESTAGPIYQATATDPETNPLTFRLGGADAGLFTLAADGQLAFKSAPDYEAPADADRNNAYALQLIVSDGVNEVTRDLVVTVTNANDGLTPKLLANYDDPVTAVPIDGNGRLVVLERAGRIFLKSRDVRGRGTLAATIRSVALGNIDAPYGVFDAVPAPDIARSGVFYVLASIRPDPSGFDRDLELYRYRLNADRTAVSAPELVFRYRMPPDTPPILPQQGSGASGGMVFGPDGYLYLGTSLSSEGDDEPRRWPLFGGVLRIDVSRDAFPNDLARNYAIPAANPAAARGAAREMITVQDKALYPRRLDVYGTTVFVANPSYQQRYGPQIVYRLRTDATERQPAKANIAYSYNGGAGPTYVTGGPVYRGPVSAYADHIIFADRESGGVFATPVAPALAGNPPPLTLEAIFGLSDVVRIALDSAQNLYFVTAGPGGGLYVAEPD